MDTQHTASESLIRDACGGHTCSWHALDASSAAWRVVCSESVWFVKTKVDALNMFIAEAEGIKALAKCQAVRVPTVLGTGVDGSEAFLVMEWLPLGRKTQHGAACMGESLARQHRFSAEYFGWQRSNFIGATPQFNAPIRSWMEFFRNYRLGFQLRLAAENGYRGALQDECAKLLDNLSDFFTGYAPAPSLLHGDLWGDNWGVLASGEPVCFDPAVYYGDREADLAMTELFGGFPQAFYAAYDAAWPLDDGYTVRRDLYNLYHVLNHLNLFGDRYLSQARRTVATLLSRLA